MADLIVNNISQKSSALTAAGCSESKLRKVCFFTAIRQNYKTLVSNKIATALTTAKCHENWPNRLVSNFRLKIHGTAAECLENKLRKVGILTAIRHSYKTIVDKKSMAIRAASCPEDWPN